MSTPTDSPVDKVLARLVIVLETGIVTVIEKGLKRTSLETTVNQHLAETKQALYVAVLEAGREFLHQQGEDDKIEAWEKYLKSGGLF